MCVAAFALVTPAEAIERLVGSTLICRQVSAKAWSAAGTLMNSQFLLELYREEIYLYVTSTHMFTQQVTVETKTGKITGGSAGIGLVFEWGRAYSGSTGKGLRFRTHATKEVGKITSEAKYRVTNALADKATIDVVQKGTVEFNGTDWVLSTEHRQSIPNAQAAVPKKSKWLSMPGKGGPAPAVAAASATLPRKETLPGWRAAVLRVLPLVHAGEINQKISYDVELIFGDRGRQGVDAEQAPRCSVLAGSSKKQNQTPP